MALLPKLLPSWHDLSLQEIVRNKNHRTFHPLKPPDFGGIGVDVNIDATSCTIPKFYKNQLKFGSDKCALPFFPLKSNSYVTEPCLESLEIEKVKFDQFSATLTKVRTMTNICEKFNTRVKTVQQEINLLNSETQNEEVNILAPKSVVQLAESIPNRTIVPTYNATYVGGNLAVCKFSDKKALIHPSCDDFNKLCITPLLDGNNQYFTPDISEQITIQLKDDPILQIDEAINGFCVRQKNSFHLVSTKNLNICSKTVHKAVLYHIAANPYNPAEILSIYEKGVMKLRNMITKKTTWSMLDNLYDNLCPLYPTWRCAFGSHPFSAMCLNESKFYSFDIREQKLAANVIFNANNPSFYVGEELLGWRQWNRNTFQHFIISSHHLTLCDERYPKTPVMYWNHCLKNLPVYLECASIDTDVSIIIAATQKDPQIVSFFCSNQGDIQPVSLNSPLLLSSPSDCVKSLKFHSYHIDDKLSKRLSSPLTGISVVPHSSEIGFTVLQLTSLGDIFYQDFKQSSDADERTYHVSTGCTLTPPEKILPHLNELMSNSDFDAVLSRNEAIGGIFLNIDQVLSPPKEISASCTFCRLNNSAEDKELVFSENCPTCSLSNAESQHFTKCMANESTLIGPASDKAGHLECDIDYLKKFDDKYSKRILSVWLEPDEAEETRDTEAESFAGVT